MPALVSVGRMMGAVCFVFLLHRENRVNGKNKYAKENTRNWEILQKKQTGFCMLKQGAHAGLIRSYNVLFSFSHL